MYTYFVKVIPKEVKVEVNLKHLEMKQAMGGWNPSKCVQEDFVGEIWAQKSQQMHRWCAVSGLKPLRYSNQG